MFVSLLSRESVYDVLRRICTHLQVGRHQVKRLDRGLPAGGTVVLLSIKLAVVYNSRVSRDTFQQKT